MRPQSKVTKAQVQRWRCQATIVEDRGNEATTETKMRSIDRDGDGDGGRRWDRSKGRIGMRWPVVTNASSDDKCGRDARISLDDDFGHGERREKTRALLTRVGKENIPSKSTCVTISHYEETVLRNNSALGCDGP
ncbi:hypothetical protein ACJRO7_002623 [Eucalyptus globulus]|uniref:Uncharacterized protein n=1 Tax=Eucalyptus globulus TaxID=34317 RepID=A0ABD3LV05_EUCGL